MKIEFIRSKKDARYAGKLITKVSNTANRGLIIIHNIVYSFSLLLIMLSLMIITQGTQEVYSHYPTYILSLIMLSIGIAIYLLNKFYTKKILLQDFCPLKITYEFLPNKIIQSSDDGLKTEISSREIKRFVDTKGFFLIFIRKNVAYYIPPIAFANETIRNECKNKINKLIENKISLEKHDRMG